MKKSTKIILITSVCLIFGGLLIAVISGTVGGAKQFKELADRHQFSFDLPFFDAQLRLNTEGVYFTSKDKAEDEGYVEDYDDIEGVHDSQDETDGDEEESISGNSKMAEGETVTDTDKIRKVKMELGAGEIEIKKSRDGDFHINEEGNMKVTSNVKGGTLEIKAGMEGDIQIFGFSTGASVSTGSAVIYLPEQVYESVTIDMGAGVCSGEVPECEEFKVDLGAGEIEFDYVKANEMELRVGAGECEIGLIEAETLEADIAMGQFTAKAIVDTELDATVGMGEIDMEIVGDENDFDYDVEVGAGEVRIGSRTYSGLGSSGSQKNDTGREINVDCGMGEARIRFVEK